MPDSTDMAVADAPGADIAIPMPVGLDRWGGETLDADAWAAVEESCKAVGAEHLLANIRGVRLPRPTGFHVLVMQFIRPEKVGSIIMAAVSQREDEWQGRTGIVLRFGPDAYRDRAKFPAGAWCEVGDWVVWPPVESAAARMKYGNAVLAMIPDDRVLVTNVDPVLANTSG